MLRHRGVDFRLRLPSFYSVLAMNVYVERFQLLLEHHTIFDGITYTDAHVTIYGLLIVCAALVLGAVISAYNAVRHSRGRWIVAAILPAVVSYGVLAIVGWYVGSFIVKPNELVREEPFIAHNIEMTRQAYGLNRFAQLECSRGRTTVDAADPANNQPTLQNIRLWDWHALQDTLRQVQEITHLLLTFLTSTSIALQDRRHDHPGDACSARAKRREAPGK